MKHESNIHRIYTAQEAEGDYPVDPEFYGEVPYSEHWETVREISNGPKPRPILDDQLWALQGYVGLPCVLAGEQGPEGIVQCDCGFGDCSEQQLFI